MRVKVHRGRTYNASSTKVMVGVYRGVFDIDSTDTTEDDGVINEATSETFSTSQAAEDAAEAAAIRWIDKDTDNTE